MVIIAMTAATLQDEQEKCQSVGMTDFLAKPAKRDDLFRILVKYMGQRSKPHAKSTLDAPGQK